MTEDRIDVNTDDIDLDTRLRFRAYFMDVNGIPRDAIANTCEEAADRIAELERAYADLYDEFLDALIERGGE